MTRFKIKIILAAGLVSVVLAAGITARYYYNSTQETISQLTQNNAQLNTAVEQSESTVQRLRSDITAIQREYSALQEDFREARESATALRRRLSEHDLGYLASERPGLVERIVNRAGKNVLRCFEILSGAPRTEDELAADRPSRANTECPAIANPNFEN